MMRKTRFPEPRQREILTVSDVVGRLRWLVEKEFRDVWICGEVTNLQVSRAGHCYFTLKDSEAQIRAVCFRMQFQYLRFKPEDGFEVRVRGGVSVYTPRGDLQVIVDIVEPAGRGSLQVAFEKLKGRLEQEGLFDTAIKQRIPLLPSRIGIITSSSGAALHDLLRVLKRRNDQVDLLIAPVQVQGRSAAVEISEAIRALNQKPDIDVLILARGGGSIEDLWAFNEEIVARAIFHSRIPVISAVGHETDFTIADFVADVRAATPSAAAEIVSAARQDLARMLAEVGPERSGIDYRFGLYFNCLARGQSLYRDGGVDAAMIREALPDVPMLGFFCNAEFGPLRGMNQLFTYTGVMALFGE